MILSVNKQVNRKTTVEKGGMLNHIVPVRLLGDHGFSSRPYWMVWIFEISKHTRVKDLNVGLYTSLNLYTSIENSRKTVRPAASLEKPRSDSCLIKEKLWGTTNIFRAAIKWHVNESKRGWSQHLWQCWTNIIRIRWLATNRIVVVFVSVFQLFAHLSHRGYFPTALTSVQISFTE